MPRNARVLVAGAAVALLLGGCGSSSSPAPSPTGTPAVTGTTPAGAPAATPTSAPSTAAATDGIAGSWTGQYQGAYSGTFHLTWTLTGSKLGGTITLSNPHGTLPLDGTVDGSSIKFGTVGSEDIQYTGSYSGTSMSGSYTVHTANGTASGTWSATKD